MAKSKQKAARLNIRIDEELKEWAMSYAHKNGIRLTNLISDYLRMVRRQEEAEQATDEYAEQI